MKRVLIIFLISSIFTIAFSQTPQMWTNIRNSAYTQNDSIYIRCETANNLVDTKMYYSTSIGWGESSLQNITGLTYQSSAFFNNQSSVYIRYRSIVDTFVIMQVPYLTDDVPTPNYLKLGFVANDNEGDTTLPIECLDIKKTYFGVSDTRIYAGMENFIQDYPTNNGGYVPTEFYFYIGGLVNPETVWQDSIVYAMVFANVPMLVEPGLYKIHGTTFSTDAIEKIGDISYNNNGDGLVMSCNLEDLINDPDFGQWPNVSNSLGFNFITLRTGLEGTVTLVDYSKTSQQLFNEQFVIAPFDNHLPQISQVSAVIGITNTEVIANYIDEDNNFPIVAKAVVHHSNGDQDTEYNLTSSGFDYSNGVNFVAQIPETDWETIDVVFSDNNSDFIQQTLYPQNAENNILVPQNSVKVYPNPLFKANKINQIEFSIDTTIFQKPILKIYNLKGEEIFETSTIYSNKMFWDFDKRIKSGIYLYKITSKNIVKFGKFTVLR